LSFSFPFASFKIELQKTVQDLRSRVSEQREILNGSISPSLLPLSEDLSLSASSLSSSPAADPPILALSRNSPSNVLFVQKIVDSCVEEAFKVIEGRMEEKRKRHRQLQPTWQPDETAGIREKVVVAASIEGE
jgi:hypothetical protein